MAECVQRIPLVKLTGIEQTGCADANWNRRLSALGREGSLYIMASRRKHPGKHFALLLTSDQLFTIKYYKTSCGDLVQTDSEILLTTRNSAYTFQILDGELNSEKEAALKIKMELYRKMKSQQGGQPNV